MTDQDSRTEIWKHHHELINELEKAWEEAFNCRDLRLDSEQYRQAEAAETRYADALRRYEAFIEKDLPMLREWPKRSIAEMRKRPR